MAAVPRPKRVQRKRVLFFYRTIFILVILWFFGQGMFHFILGMLVESEIVQKSVVEEKVTLEGYLIRDEVVINSPVTGRIVSKISEGERVAVTMPVMEVEVATGTALENGEPYIISAPISGIVSYKTDGLEDIFQPNSLQSLDIDNIEQLQMETIDNTGNDVVKKGNRLCKIVNNLGKMQIFFQFPLDVFASPLQKGQELVLNFPQVGKKVTGVIIDLKGIANTAQVLVELPDTMYQLLNQRKEQVELVTQRREGIYISKESIVNKDNETGVYGLKKGFVFWLPVKIISEDGEKIMVEGIDPLTEIILNPQLVKEGQHIK